MTKQISKFFILTILSLSLSGCIVTKQQALMLDDIEALKKENAEQKGKINNLESILFNEEGSTNLLEELNNTLRKQLADNVEAIEEIRTEFAQAKGFFEEQLHNLEVLNETISEVENKLALSTDKKELTSEDLITFKLLMNEEITFIKTSIDELRKEILSLKASTKSSTTKKSNGVKKNDKQTEYMKGYQEILDKKYSEGRKTLKGFLKENPSNDLSDNAQYWIGESYYAQGDWERSVLEFNNVVKNFPKSDKVPGSLLKLAYSFEKLKANKEAQIVYKKIIKEYPKSKEAEEAKKKITK